MKHAFLIIAHNKYKQLQKLIDLLDDERFDIYVHIDKKSILPTLKSTKSKLYLLKNRIDVRWGDISQIECELSLFESASKRERYDYYHLISGIDLPIKSNDYIYNFFETNKGFEFINYVDESNYIRKRVGRYVLGTRYQRPKNIKEKTIYYLTSHVQPILDKFYKRKFQNTEYKMGANWASITHEFCLFLLLNKQNILKTYSHTTCTDEIYKQTLCWNSKFKKNLYDSNYGYKGCVRLIDWKRGNPYTWGQYLEDDKEIITKSEALFVRKIDAYKYPGIVNFIEKEILNK